MKSTKIKNATSLKKASHRRTKRPAVKRHKFFDAGVFKRQMPKKIAAPNKWRVFGVDIGFRNLAIYDHASNTAHVFSFASLTDYYEKIARVVQKILLVAAPSEKEIAEEAGGGGFVSQHLTFAGGETLSSEQKNIQQHLKEPPHSPPPPTTPISIRPEAVAVFVEAQHMQKNSCQEYFLYGALSALSAAANATNDATTSHPSSYQQQQQQHTPLFCWRVHAKSKNVYCRTELGWQYQKLKSFKRFSTAVEASPRLKEFTRGLRLVQYSCGSSQQICRRSLVVRKIEDPLDAKIVALAGSSSIFDRSSGATYCTKTRIL